MEDSELENIIHDDPVPRKPREQLARNLRAAELVFEEAYGAIVRIYRFTPGVILGLNQSLDDVNREECERHGYEIVRRPTGGSAVIVDPEQTLCYSFFFPSNSRLPNIVRSYHDIVVPFASHLGDGMIVDRLFSLIPPGSEHPLAGHAMAHHYHNAITQLDGIFHVSAPDADRFARLLKMRELYEHNETPIIASNGSYYSRTGRVLADVDVRSLMFKRSEHDEISRFVGLRSIGMSESKVTRALYHTARMRFGPITLTDQLDYADLTHHLERVDRAARTPKKWNAQGHCFVDF
jgi:hypothetical protein